jgi:hypothetical protein
MSDFSTCTACTFVHRQLGSGASCPLHSGLEHAPTREAPVAESYVTTRPTADAPWPFTSREYARLLLLRSRVQEGLIA